MTFSKPISSFNFLPPGTICFPRSSQSPLLVCRPRMFRYTLHLQSNTAHSSVPRGFRPTLTYLFEAKRLTSLRATLQTIRGLRVVVPKTVFSTPIQAFAPSSNAENPPGPDRSPPMSIRSNNFVQVTTRVVPLQSVSEPPPPRRLRTRHKTHPLPNPNGDKNAKQTKKLRAAELNAWENDPYIRKFRIFQLFLCWLVDSDLEMNAWLENLALHSRFASAALSLTHAGLQCLSLPPSPPNFALCTPTRFLSTPCSSGRLNTPLPYSSPLP